MLRTIPWTEVDRIGRKRKRARTHILIHTHTPPLPNRDTLTAPSYSFFKKLEKHTLNKDRKKSFPLLRKGLRDEQLGFFMQINVTGLDGACGLMNKLIMRSFVMFQLIHTDKRESGSCVI